MLDDLKEINPSIIKEYFDENEINGWEGWSDGQKVIINRLIYDIRLFDGTKPFDIEDVEAKVIKMYLIETVSSEFADWYPNEADVIRNVIEDMVMYAAHVE
jgi:hypothetical protein